MPRAILDTNVFVGAGFRRSSASARLIEAVREGRLAMIWHEATRAETRRVLTRIPPISWDAVAGVFLPEQEWTGTLDLDAVAFVTDPEDRKFAALSQAACAPVVTSDDDLLAHAGRIVAVKPGTFLGQIQG